MAITITRDLNVVSVGVPPVIHLSQYDSDFTLVFNLYASTGAFTMPTGTTAEIRGTKRDGNGYDAAASVSGSTVTVTGDEQMTAIAGQNMFEIATYYNNKRLNTINFILDVERAALDADTITSESVLRELDAIIQGAATATQAAEDAEDAADRAEEAADDLSGTVQQVATNTQDIAGLKDDLEQIVPGLSVEAKEALLACFQNVAWIGTDGQDYYDALEAALYDEPTPPIHIDMINGYAMTNIRTQDGNKYVKPSEVSARMCFEYPVENKHYQVSTVDQTKYQLFALPVLSNEASEYGYQVKPGYFDNSWQNSYEVIESPYYVTTVKKLDGTSFTQDEVSDPIRRVFVYGEHQYNVKCFVNQPTVSSIKWCDYNNVIGIHNISDLALVNGYGLNGDQWVDNSQTPPVYHIETEVGCYPTPTINRAMSLSQAIIGNLDGKKITATTYTLSSGSAFQYAYWYGYINDSTREFLNTQYISVYHVFNGYYDEERTLPIDTNISGTRILFMVFRVKDETRPFTQAELLEIPTLMRIV